MPHHEISSSTEITYQSTPHLRRTDFRVLSEPGVEIGVRRVEPNGQNEGLPILLVHGARAPGVPSFDLDVPGGSLAATLAELGHPVYLMDARNYGNSTRLPEMMSDPASNEPLSRSHEVIRDIVATVETICTECDVESIAAMGWATGSQWLSYYAATYPRRISHLVVYNGLWPVASDWPMGDALEDPDRPGEMKPGAPGAYGLATAQALLARWNDSIPVDNLDDWRDPAVAEAYANQALATDSTAENRNPPSIRTPLGAIADSFLLSRGHQLFEPGAITSRVLIVRSELDFWSREIDVTTARDTLKRAASVEVVTLPEATHFVHLDRAERGRDRLLEAVARLLQDTNI